MFERPKFVVFPGSSAIRTYKICFRFYLLIAPVMQLCKDPVEEAY